MRETLFSEHRMSISVRELDQIPMASSLGYLIRDGTAGSTKKDQLLGTQMNHIEKSFETHSGIALKRANSMERVVDGRQGTHYINNVHDENDVWIH